MRHTQHLRGLRKGHNLESWPHLCWYNPGDARNELTGPSMGGGGRGGGGRFWSASVAWGSAGRADWPSSTDRDMEIPSSSSWTIVLACTWPLHPNGTKMNRPFTLLKLLELAQQCNRKLRTLEMDPNLINFPAHPSESGAHDNKIRRMCKRMYIYKAPGCTLTSQCGQTHMLPCCPRGCMLVQHARSKKQEQQRKPAADKYQRA